MHGKYSGLTIEAIGLLLEPEHIHKFGDQLNEKNLEKVAYALEEKAEPLVKKYGERLAVKYVLAKALEAFYKKDCSAPQVNRLVNAIKG